MIRITVDITMKSEDKEQLLRLLGEMGDLSRQESGCLHYEVLENCRVDTNLAIIEMWASEEALALHKGSAHFARLIPPAKALARRWESWKFMD